MIDSIANAVREFSQEKGVSKDLIHKTIESALYAAYKKTYGTDENAVVEFSEDQSVRLFSKKKIVEEVEDPVLEISLKEALEFNEHSEISDSLLIEIDPHSFNRIAILTAKQNAVQMIRRTKRDALYIEYSNKIGDMVVGYYQRERNGTIYVDLGNTEGILPKKFQSPRESYQQGDRLKVLIYKVEKTNSELQIIVSRTHPEFVLRIFELEVPEVYDRTVEIVKIAREPGYRTKLMVRSSRSDVDPVGACVGVKGSRILSIIRELVGEKIDIIKYSTDPREFIKDALAPASVKSVFILNEAKRQALVVVSKDQLSLCIGKMGLNVRLANRLVDWNIDIKTEEQFAETDLSSLPRRNMMIDELFEEESEEEITDIAELPGITEEIISILHANEISRISDLVVLVPDRLTELKGITSADVEKIMKILESVLVVEQQTESESAQGKSTAGAEEGDKDTESSQKTKSHQTIISNQKQEAEQLEESEGISIDELSMIPAEVINKLKKANIMCIEDLIQYDHASLKKKAVLTDEEVTLVLQIVKENVNVVELEE